MKKKLLFALCATALTGGPHVFAMRNAASGSSDGPENIDEGSSSSATFIADIEETMRRHKACKIYLDGVFEPIWRSEAPDKSAQQAEQIAILLALANTSQYPQEQMRALEKLWTSENAESHRAAWLLLNAEIRDIASPHHEKFFDLLRRQDHKSFHGDENEIFENTLFDQIPPLTEENPRFKTRLYWEKLFRLSESTNFSLKGAAFSHLGEGVQDISTPIQSRY